MNNSGNEPAQGNFTTTHWSVVMEAGLPESKEQLEALEDLCQTYWHPLYFYVRRKGLNAEAAKDLIQSFFAKLIEKNYLDAVDPAQGKFRSFLMMAVKRHMANEWRKECADKRGGRFFHVSLDFNSADHLYASTETENAAPEGLYDRTWALTVLNRVLEELESQHRKKGQVQLFAFLKSTLPGFHQSMPYEQASDQLGRPVGTLKSDVNRCRRAFKQLFREVIAETVQDESDIDGEIRHLISALV